MVMVARKRPSPVAAVAKSDNRKLGPVAATYVSQASCPRACPFFGHGCYAERSFVGFTTRKLNRAGVKARIKLARLEADAVDRLKADRSLRLHVVGDSTTKGGTKLLAAAARRWRIRGGGPVWTYTHGWRTVPRALWAGVSVLASCETAADVVQAHGAGYAAALAVEYHPADGRAHPLAGAEGFKVVPCPAQTRDGVQCADCRLCMDAARLHRAKLVIGFAAHGREAGKVRIALQMLNA